MAFHGEEIELKKYSLLSLPSQNNTVLNFSNWVSSFI